VGENLTLVRRSAFGQRDLYWSLGIAFVIGLAAHVGGFLLKSSATTEPLLLVADLLYARPRRTGRPCGTYVARGSVSQP
jgi:hypothetical protein